LENRASIRGRRLAWGRKAQSKGQAMVLGKSSRGRGLGIRYQEETWRLEKEREMARIERGIFAL